MAPSDPADPGAPAGTPHADIQAEIRNRIGGSTEIVRQRVVDAAAEEEIAKRAKKLADGISRLRSAVADLKKLERHDQKLLDGDGKIVHSGYSEAKFKDLKKARETTKRLQDAIDAAVAKADYSRLDKVLSGKPEKDADDTEET